MFLPLLELGLLWILGVVICLSMHKTGLDIEKSK